MSNVAIHVENLGKMYHIGWEQESYRTFRDAIIRTVFAPFCGYKLNLWSASGEM